jgi:diguanylate cyclase (GGDEF)-like protein
VSRRESNPGTGSHRCRNWSLWGAPAQIIAYLLAMETLAAVAVVAALSSAHWSAEALLRTLLLFGLAVFYEEVSAKAGRLRIRLSELLKPDMTSVWSFPAAIVLPPAYALACVTALLGYLWTRQQRPAGEQAYRKIGSASTVLLACVAGGLAARAIGTHFRTIPGGVSGALAVIVALVAYTAVNRVLVTGALLLFGARGKHLIGTWDDNVLEIATLCLGGLASVALLHEPLLTILVLVPMVLLQRAALVRRLEVAAMTDSKTGLLNALAWEQLAQHEVARAARSGRSTAIFMLDLDRFKTVNDVHGHLAGDAVLKKVGQILTEELRSYDSVGRFGGEEFVAVLPETGDEEALHIAERTRARIHATRVSDVITLSNPEDDRSLSASVGVACSPVDGPAVSDLLLAADAALYRAKVNGRNRVELAARGIADYTDNPAVG